MEETIPTPPPATPIVPGEVDSAPRAQPASAGGRSRLRPSPAEWVLFAYLAVVIAVTTLRYVMGHGVVDALASSPDDVAGARVWPLITSGLLADGPLWPQVVATAVLGVWAIRLASGRAFWAAAILAHVLGTLLVYAGVWVVDAQYIRRGVADSRGRLRRLACVVRSAWRARGRRVVANAASALAHPRVPRPCRACRARRGDGLVRRAGAVRARGRVPARGRCGLRRPPLGLSRRSPSA